MSAQSLKYVRSDKGQETRRRYYEKTKQKDHERKRARRAIYAQEHPDKVRARSLFGKAIKHGFIKRPDDKPNWHNRWEFHHPDHTRPYYGVWVNPSEHRRIDAGQVECPRCHDYTQDVLRLLLDEWGLSSSLAKLTEVSADVAV
jgi:hypothetical protein